MGNLSPSTGIFFTASPDYNCAGVSPLPSVPLFSCNICSGSSCDRRWKRVPSIRKNTSKQTAASQPESRSNPFFLLGKAAVITSNHPAHAVCYPFESLPLRPADQLLKTNFHVAVNFDFPETFPRSTPGIRSSDTALSAASVTEFLFLRPMFLCRRTALICAGSAAMQEATPSDTFCRNATLPASPVDCVNQNEFQASNLQLELAVLSNGQNSIPSLEPLVKDADLNPLSSPKTSRRMALECCTKTVQQEDGLSGNVFFSKVPSFDVWAQYSHAINTTWFHLGRSETLDGIMRCSDGAEVSSCRSKVVDFLPSLVNAAFHKKEVCTLVGGEHNFQDRATQHCHDEIDIVIRCCYKALMIDHKDKNNWCLNEDRMLESNLRNKPKYSVDSKKSLVNLAEANYVALQDSGVSYGVSGDNTATFFCDPDQENVYALPTLAPPPYKNISGRYCAVYHEGDSFKLALQCGETESLAQVESNLQQLYSGSESTLCYVNGLALAAVVRLRLRYCLTEGDGNGVMDVNAFNPDSQNATVEKQNKDLRPIAVKWDIIEVQGGRPRDLQALLLEFNLDGEREVHHESEDSALALASASIDSSDFNRERFAWKRRNNVLTTYALAKALDEWFDNVCSSAALVSETPSPLGSLTVCRLSSVQNEFEKRENAVCFVTTQRYRSSRVLAAFNSLSADSRQLCMQETILQHLPTLRKAWIEWAISQSVSRIILFGWAALSDVSSWQRRNVESCLDLGDPFFLLGSALLLLIDTRKPDGLNNHVVDTYNSVMGVSKKSNLEQANLFFPHNVHPSFEATLLLFIDCCFYLYLDKRRFPESLTRNVQLLGTKSASSVDDISAPLTPIMFLLWLYRSLSSTHSLDSSVWTPALRVCLLHFVSVLASLIAKQQSCTKPVSSFWSPFWTSHCLPIASALVVCIAHSTETADCRDASLPYMAQIAENLWKDCEALCETLPLWHPRRVKAEVDAARFRNDWVTNPALSPKRRNGSLNLRNCAQSAIQMMEYHSENLQERFFLLKASRFFLNVSQEVGRVLHLFALRLNVAFLSKRFSSYSIHVVVAKQKLLEHPDARHELLRELNERQEDTETGSTAENSTDESHGQTLRHYDACNFSTHTKHTTNFAAPKTSLLNNLSKMLFRDSFSSRSRLCSTRVEFMNYLEVTESNFMDYSQAAIPLDPVLCGSIDERFLPSKNETFYPHSPDFRKPGEATILDVVEWLKRFCWVFSFPGLQWNYGCEWISGDTILTTLSQDSGTLSATQVTDIVKDEINHSASVLGLRSLELVASVPYFLVDDLVDRVRCGAAHNNSKSVAIETLHRYIRYYSDCREESA